MYVGMKHMKEKLKRWGKEFLNCCTLVVIATIVYKMGEIVKNDTFQIVTTIALTAYAATIQKNS